MDFSKYGDIITFDTFLQGLILIFCFTIGSLVFFTDSFKKEPEKDEEEEEQGTEKNAAEEEEEVKGTLTKLNSRFSSVFFEALRLILGEAIGVKFDNTDTGGKRVSKAALVAPVVIFASLTIGIFVKTAGDIWMNQENEYHAGMQYWWQPDDPTDLKVKWFDRIYKDPNPPHKHSLKCHLRVLKGFPHLPAKVVPIQDSTSTVGVPRKKRKLSRSDKSQHYYFASNMIMNHKDFGPRLKESRIRAEYSQVFSLSFFILFVMAWLNLVSTRFRIFIRDIQLHSTPGAEKSPLKILIAAYKAALDNPINTLISLTLALAIIYSLLTNFIDLPAALGSLQDNKITSFSIWVLTFSPLFIWMWSWWRYRMEENKAKIEELSESSEEYADVDISDRNVFTINYFTIVFLYIGLIGYLTSAAVWKKAEANKVKKAFGYYVNINESLTGQKEKMIQDHLNIEVKKNDTVKK